VAADEHADAGDARVVADRADDRLNAVGPQAHLPPRVFPDDLGCARASVLVGMAQHDQGVHDGLGHLLAHHLVGEGGGIACSRRRATLCVSFC